MREKKAIQSKDTVIALSKWLNEHHMVEADRLQSHWKISAHMDVAGDKDICLHNHGVFEPHTRQLQSTPMPSRPLESSFSSTLSINWDNKTNNFF
jgi:hypothetical protein